jgi:hypothetical protein
VPTRFVHVFSKENTKLQLQEVIDCSSRFSEAAGELTGYLVGEVAFHGVTKSGT